MSPDPDIGARSYLYVPGHRKELFEKAMAGDADAIVLDLEDAVDSGHKETARANVTEFLASGVTGKEIWIRVNGPSSPHHSQDLVAIAPHRLDGVRIPGAEAPRQIKDAARILRESGAARPKLSLLIESATGLQAIEELASCDEAVIAIALGEADLMHDLGLEDEAALEYARSRCVCASRAAGLGPPVQSVYVDLSSPEGLRQSTLRGRHYGFFGRSVIHPKQVAVVNAVFTPTGSEVKEAKEVLENLGAARLDGHGGAVKSGRFIDAPALKAAQRVLRIAERFGVAE